jgi:hypothetical protein
VIPEQMGSYGSVIPKKMGYFAWINSGARFHDFQTGGFLYMDDS